MVRDLSCRWTGGKVGTTAIRGTVLFQGQERLDRTAVPRDRAKRRSPIFFFSTRSPLTCSSEGLERVRASKSGREPNTPV